MHPVYGTLIWTEESLRVSKLVGLVHVSSLRGEPDVGERM